MMCRTTLPPPPTLNTGKFNDLNTHEAAEARIDDPTCNSCHGMFETVGLALEHYDATGRWRDAYEDGVQVDASGSWPGPDPQQFEGMIELSNALAANEELDRCTAQRAAEFAFGREATAVFGQPESCMAKPIADAFVASGGDLRELIVGLVLSDGFRLRDPGDETPTCE